MHLLAYPAWVIAWLHAIGVGTDATSPEMIALAMISAGAVAGALVARWLSPPVPRGTRPLPERQLAIPADSTKVLGPAETHKMIGTGR